MAGYATVSETNADNQDFDFRPTIVDADSDMHMFRLRVSQSVRIKRIGLYELKILHDKFWKESNQLRQAGLI